MKNHEHKLCGLIAIDPDLNKSGLAIYDLETKKYTGASTYYLWSLFHWLGHWDLSQILVLIEDSNLIKTSWHGTASRSNVGKNKAVSKLIVDFCKVHKIAHRAIKPDGYSQYFDKIGKGQYVHLVGKTFPNNSETRSAVAIIECNKHLYEKS
jgi:hypothetical protein